MSDVRDEDGELLSRIGGCEIYRRWEAAQREHRAALSAFRAREAELTAERDRVRDLAKQEQVLWRELERRRNEL
jgi:hypothetical protein